MRHICSTKHVTLQTEDRPRDTSRQRGPLWRSRDYRQPNVLAVNRKLLRQARRHCLGVPKKICVDVKRPCGGGGCREVVVGWFIRRFVDA
jgi:hypothetical protein